VRGAVWFLAGFFLLLSGCYEPRRNAKDHKEKVAEPSRLCFFKIQRRDADATLTGKI
jgi:hypothetical protein